MVLDFFPAPFLSLLKQSLQLQGTKPLVHYVIIYMVWIFIQFVLWIQSFLTLHCPGGHPPLTANIPPRAAMAPVPPTAGAMIKH